MGYTKKGPFTNAAAPGIDEAFLNGVEDWIASLGEFTNPAVQLASTGDWNTVLDSGVYRGSGLANQTPHKTHSWQYTLVIRHADIWVTQIAVDFSGNGFSYRTLSNGSWTAWFKLAQQSDLDAVKAEARDEAVKFALILGGR